jgi:chromosome segregation ATPase
LLPLQVVVDTTDTGMRLVQDLNRQRSGRVTFMPLDALRVQEVRPCARPRLPPLLSLPNGTPTRDQGLM